MLSSSCTRKKARYSYYYNTSKMLMTRRYRMSTFSRTRLSAFTAKISSRLIWPIRGRQLTLTTCCDKGKRTRLCYLFLIMGLALRMRILTSSTSFSAAWARPDRWIQRASGSDSWFRRWYRRPLAAECRCSRSTRQVRYSCHHSRLIGKMRYLYLRSPRASRQVHLGWNQIWARFQKFSSRVISSKKHSSRELRKISSKAWFRGAGNC